MATKVNWAELLLVRCNAFHEKASPVKSLRSFRSSFVAVATPAFSSHPPGFHPHSS
jgi:hypothetical protein